MISRKHYLSRVRKALGRNPVVALLGPRQCGKTTLARMFGESEPCAFFDLESPVDVRRLSAPMTVLEGLSGWAVIDEVQRRPDLFELLRVLVDRQNNPARFLLLGSASPYLVKGVSEFLAGRIGFVDLAGFDLWEVGVERQTALWLRGGFPRSFLAEDEEASMAWREGFIRTFLERDIPQLGITIPAETLQLPATRMSPIHLQELRKTV